MTAAACWRAGHDVELHRITGKGHGMIHGAAEMRHIMTFWAQRLGSRPAPEVAGDEDLIEVSS